MLEDVCEVGMLTHELEEILNAEIGIGAADSGAILPIMGKGTWRRWLELGWIQQNHDKISYRMCQKILKFGDSKTLLSNHYVSFTVNMLGNVRTLIAYLIDGNTPLLVARPTLED